MLKDPYTGKTTLLFPKLTLLFFNPSNALILARAVNKLEKVKVKVTLVQALRLCTDRTAHRVSRGIAVHFHDHGTRRG